jgi:hypothetical protein
MKFTQVINIDHPKHDTEEADYEHFDDINNEEQFDVVENSQINPGNSMNMYNMERISEDVENEQSQISLEKKNDELNILRKDNNEINLNQVEDENHPGIEDEIIDDELEEKKDLVHALTDEEKQYKEAHIIQKEETKTEPEPLKNKNRITKELINQNNKHFFDENDKLIFDEIERKVFKHANILERNPGHQTNELNVLKGLEQKVKIIQNSYKRYKDRLLTNKINKDKIYLGTDKTEKHIISIFVDKETLEGQIKGIFVKIYSKDKMKTFSEIFSISEFYKDKESMSRNVFHANINYIIQRIMEFLQFKLLATSDMNKSQSTYSIISNKVESPKQQSPSKIKVLKKGNVFNENSNINGQQNNLAESLSVIPDIDYSF